MESVILSHSWSKKLILTHLAKDLFNNGTFDASVSGSTPPYSSTFLQASFIQVAFISRNALVEL